MCQLGIEKTIAQDHEDTDIPVPVLEITPQPHFGSAKGQITIAEDFDAPLEDFIEYAE